MNKKKILIFVPAYNCEKQIGRVIDQLEQSWVGLYVSQIIVVDNQSKDKTSQVVADRIRKRGDNFIKLLRNQSNYGLGGSHKVAFQYAKENEFDWVIVLHGDDQGSISDFKSIIEFGGADGVDAFLGSRFMQGATAIGYSKLRILGNLVFNLIYSFCVGRRIFDMGSGLNMYRVASLRCEQYLQYPDGQTFNNVMVCAQVIEKDVLEFVPITWREDDQVSNVKLLQQSFETLKIPLFALFSRRIFPVAEHRRVKVAAYKWTVQDV